MSSRQYRGCSANISKSDTGMLCSWFQLQEVSTTFFKICGSQSHSVHHTFIYFHYMIFIVIIFVLLHIQLASGEEKM